MVIIHHAQVLYDDVISTGNPDAVARFVRPQNCSAPTVQSDVVRIDRNSLRQQIYLWFQLCIVCDQKSIHVCQYLQSNLWFAGQPDLSQSGEAAVLQDNILLEGLSVFVCIPQIEFGLWSEGKLQ